MAHPAEAMMNQVLVAFGQGTGPIRVAHDAAALHPGGWTRTIPASRLNGVGRRRVPPDSRSRG
jgi:hypothetical protein